MLKLENYIMKKLITPMLVLMLFAGCTVPEKEIVQDNIVNSSKSNQGWVEYTNSSYEFSAQIPEGWTVEEINDGRNINIAKSNVSFEEAWDLPASELAILRIDFDKAEELLYGESEIIESKIIKISDVVFDYQILDTNFDQKVGVSPEDIVLYVKPSIDDIQFPTFTHFASLGESRLFDEFLESISFTLPSQK